MSDKRALVLGTGGVRGAYYTGLHGAIRHLGINFDTIVGASAGAIAGAWMACGMPDEELVSWKEFSKFRIAWHPVFDNDLYKTVDKSIQITTLKFIDLERLKSAPTRLIVAASRLMMNGEYLRESFDIQKIEDTETIGKCLRASAFLPYVNGLDAAVEINGSKYRDAGLTGRIPLDLLPDENYDEIWIALCSPASIRELPKVLDKFDSSAQVRIIQPSRDLPVGRMSSAMEKIEKTIDIGYLDGLNAFRPYLRESDLMPAAAEEIDPEK